MVGANAKALEADGTRNDLPALDIASHVKRITKLFDSVWRFTWDELIGYNLADPSLFELHFFNVSIPRPGGIQ